MHQLYRSVAREVGRRNRDVAASLRRVFETALADDAANAATFLRAQRAHKTLLERYGAPAELSGGERIEATARRVGLRMPA